MADNYIITNTQQGQPQNRKGAVGPSNVAAAEKPDPIEVPGEDAASIPEKFPPGQTGARPAIVTDHSAKSMQDKIGKKIEP
jgi:hypothetical protein